MFGCKRRGESKNKLVQKQIIQSFDQQRGNLQTALSLTLRKSFKPPASSSIHQKSKQRFQSFALSYPSLFKSKKHNFQKLLQNRKLLNERGRQLRDYFIRNSIRVDCLTKTEDIQSGHFSKFLLQRKRKLKADLSCRGLSYLNLQSGYDQIAKGSMKQLQKKQKSRKLRMTEPFENMKRMQTMPDFETEEQIMLCPWEAKQ